MEQINKQELAVKFEKMLRLAFDAAAAPSEAENAIRLMAKIAKNNGFSFEDVKALLGITGSAQKSVASCASQVIHFGKHIGKSIAEVYRIDPDYLEWVLRETTGKTKLKQQIIKFLESMDQD